MYGPFGEVVAGVVPDTVVGGMDPGWLGQHQRRSDAGSGRGVIQMGVRPYVPAAGRFLGVDPVEGGNANDYVYPQDPINSFDLDGRACVSTLVPGLIIGKGRVHGKCPDTKQYRDLAARTAPAINPTAKRTRVMVTEREKRAASAPQVDLIPFCSNLGTGAKLTTTAAMELGKETLKKGVLKGVVRFIPVVNWVIWGHDAACLVQELDP